MGGRLTKVLVLAALAFAVTASSSTAASPARGRMLGAVRHAGGAPHSFGTLGAANPSGPLFLQESPCAPTSTPKPCWTMRTNTTYAIYWVPSGYMVDANYESLINRYLADVAAASGSLTNAYSVATQYYDNAAAIHYQSTFGGSYVDTNPFPASGCNDFHKGSGDPVCLTDQQIQDEIQNVLTAKGWHAGPDTMFFLLTPKGVGSCFDGTSSECTTNAYCAYHNDFVDSSGDPVIYANEPYDATIPGGGCWDGTSPNGDDADATINTMSHEHNESITDPLGDAWLNSTGAENGDICAWNFGSQLGTAANGQPYNQLINGHQYWLQEEYSNDGNACLQHYTPTVAPSTVASPVVSGTAALGQVLSTSDGSWMHAPSGYTYQWQRCAADGTGCANISGATAATYQLTASDVQHVVLAEVSAQNAAGTSAFVTSAPTSVVVGPPSATAAPVLSGVAAVGKTLSTTSGTWTTSASFAYQWLRCTGIGTGCTAISGATSASHVVVPADAGNKLETSVTATNIVGTAQALSRVSGVVVAVPRVSKAPRISGRARAGRRLSASRGSWSGPPKSYRYQWLRCNARGGSCVRIRHATHATYRLARLDTQHRLRVQVTAVNAAGSRKATSRGSARVPATR
jgi:hypothetical protein